MIDIDKVINPPMVVRQLYTTRSLKDLIISDTPRGWRRWVLGKLIPEKYNELPPVELCKIQKGQAIGKVCITSIDGVNDLSVGNGI